MREICFMSNRLYQLCFVLVLGLLVSSCSQERTNAALPDAAKQNTTLATATPPKIETTNNEDNDKSEKKALVNGQEITLSENDEGKCRLSTGDETIDLDIPSGCDFHRLPNNDVRVFPKDFLHFYGNSQKKIEQQYSGVSIILVEQSVTLETSPKDCRTQLQAIRIEGSKIEKSKKPMLVGSCPAGLWDEKNFTAPFQTRKQK